jgi:pimeloyl-ACP methyl ester carboxylesterase
MTYHSLETADRRRHFYLDDGAGAPVILLHCSSGSSSAWTAVIHGLGRGYRTLAPDLLGYGRNSPWPRCADLGPDSELAIVDSLLDACGEPAHLVGHSYGGTVALNAVRRSPRRVASLTLIEPVAFQLLRDADELNDWREVAALAEQHIALTAQGHDIEAARAFITYWMGSAAWQQMPEAMRDSIVQTRPQVAAEWRLMFALHDDLDTIAGIHTPTLLICGGRTRKPARRVMEKIRSALPEAHYLEIPDAGHMSPLSHPAEVADAIRAHIDSVPRWHRPAA